MAGAVYSLIGIQESSLLTIYYCLNFIGQRACPKLARSLLGDPLAIQQNLTTSLRRMNHSGRPADMPDHNMPSTQDVQQLWTAEGLRLSHAERDQPWLCGKWWNSGEALGHGARKRIVTSPEWKAAGGLAHGTMRNRGAVTRGFPEVSLRSDISYSHHAAVMCLKDDAAAHAVLADAIRYGWSDNRTAIEAKRIKFGYYVTHSADIETGLGGLIQRKEMFGGVCADVPWEFGAGLVKWGRTSTIGRCPTNNSLRCPCAKSAPIIRPCFCGLPRR